MRLLEPRGEERLRIAAAGDVGVIGAARARARRDGYDAVLAALRPALLAADFGFANLEFPVGEEALVRPGRSREFWHDPEIVPALAKAGARVLSLANNHAMDAGPEGLARTLAACERAGVTALGAGPDLAAARRVVVLPARGRRVAWLAAAAVPEEDRARADSPGVAPLDSGTLRADLERARGEADVVVVSVHWGSMYVDYPPPRVLEAVALLAEHADLVLGHHPHVLQGFERRGRALVLYSLGDAAFNCRAGDFHASVAAETRLQSAVFTVTLAAEPGLELSPLKLDEDGMPREADGAEAGAVLARVQTLSAGLAEAEARFASEAAPRLLRYELESLGHYLRQGRLDRVLRLLGGIRPRHLPLLWQAFRRLGRAA